MRHPTERDYYSRPRSLSWQQHVNRHHRWQRGLTLFIGGMGLLGWLLLFLFIWVATP